MLIKTKLQLCVFKEANCDGELPLPLNNLFCYTEVHNLTADGFVVIMEIKKKNPLPQFMQSG